MTSGKKIVVVDDTAEILDLLTLVLSDEGYQVVCCRDGRYALDTILAEQPALVIMDLTMDGVRSWELVDALLADPRTASTPFIVCSGAVQALEAAEERLRALGGDVLVKPFDLDHLLEKVQAMIGRAGRA
jgi:two-component system, sensor histidine kinase and response regulator